MNNFLILIILLLLIRFSLCIKYRCPTDEKTVTQLSPCYCGQEFAQSAWKVTVVCKSFVDYQKLYDSLQALDDYKIDELIIYGSNLKYLPKNVFKKGRVQINTISIIASIVEDITDDNTGSTGESFFDNLSDSLKVLRVEWSKGIGQWNWKKVANSLTDATDTTTTPPTKLSALEEIYLFKNDMNGVLSSDFDSMSTDTDDDVVKTGRDKTKGLQPIRVIIRQNGLKFIDATLDSFRSMQVLDLSWNVLEKTKKLFSSKKPKGFPYSLLTLYLNNNKLTKLMDYDDVWPNVPNLEYVDYRGNKINCNFASGTAVTIMNDRNNNGQPLLDGVCYSPASVRYKSLMSALASSVA